MGHFKAAFFQNIIGEVFMLFISCSSLLGFYLHMISGKDTDMKKPSCFKRLEEKEIKRSWWWWWWWWWWWCWWWKWQWWSVSLRLISTLYKCQNFSTAQVFEVLEAGFEPDKPTKNLCWINHGVTYTSHLLTPNFIFKSTLLIKRLTVKEVRLENVRECASHGTGLKKELFIFSGNLENLY